MRKAADLYSEGGYTWGLAFSPDSKILAASRSDGVVLWNIAEQRVEGKLKGHDREVHPVVFSPDGKFIATGSADMTVRLWDSKSRQLLRTLKATAGGSTRWPSHLTARSWFPAAWMGQ
ncbi:MAG: hypothetical protein AUI36_07330 [Cyanobacteria bacterium 13_1_40CM_2_61_4]|nr:MAG: hypothetical protein AUI36_07330 [Cyanobacteria bacterium 13_1_40CM_2_61_4]